VNGSNTESEAGLVAEDAQKLNSFFSTFGGRNKSLLLLDYDGTLAAFRVNRFTSKPWAGVRELLHAIQRQDRSHIAVITGRPAIEILPMLGLEKAVEVWGLHGAERICEDGHRELEQISEQAREHIASLHEQLRRDSLGGLLEAKPNAAVMHWRGASAEKARRIEERTLDLFQRYLQFEGFRLLKFEAGVELRVGRDKGGAVEAIMNAQAGNGPVAYLGDDLTDESAFRAVNACARPHMSVLVKAKRRESAAEIWLRPPAELRAFLKQWLEAGNQA